MTTLKPKNKQNRMVWVCASCLCASCWHGEFYCEQYKTANIKKMAVKDLKKLNLEHPDHYSVRKIIEVYGGVHEL